MQNIEDIAERIREAFEQRTAARDRALSQARTLIRHCSQAIRAVHREDYQQAQNSLAEARQLVESLRLDLADYPELYYAGYTQDALKEYSEANIVHSLIDNSRLPTPEELNVEYATYMQGLAESVGELRRRILDVLRHGHSEEVERLLNHMDDIYAILVTMDYPDAVTGGLRRLTDIARSLVERTRGDVLISLRQQQLEDSLQRLERRLQQLQNKQPGTELDEGDPRL